MARYTDEFRASAVLMLQAAGYKPNGEGKEGALMHVSKKLKVPHSTLGRWFRADSNPPPSKTVQEKRVALVDLLEDELHYIFDEMGNARQDATYQQLGTVAGILFDKRQLLTGGPTENINQRSITVIFAND